MRHLAQEAKIARMDPDRSVLLSGPDLTKLQNMQRQNRELYARQLQKVEHALATSIASSAANTIASRYVEASLEGLSLSGTMLISPKWVFAMR